jgi:hypothetical protein
MSAVLDSIFRDDLFSPELKSLMRKFYDAANRTVEGLLANTKTRQYLLNRIKGVVEDVPNSDQTIFNMQSIYFTAFDGLGVSVDKRDNIQREKRVVTAFWLCLLECFRKHTTIQDMKYPTMASFLQVYRSYGDNVSTIAQESEKEKINLWQTANWMTVLLSMVPARKSKDLAIQVVPKLIEGWEGNVSYWNF